jgi:fucose-1-phosphate guanylyltransferase
MLEMCLAMLCDIPALVDPGAVMIKCGDDIIIFDAQACRWNLPGFTALAHRSPVDIALTHGVFCLALPDTTGADLPANPTCRRFTHKPSLEKMRRFRATLNDDKEAFTDSTFLFDSAVAAKLLAWWDSECGGKPPPFELDAYGDMLQALGPEADGEYLGEGGEEGGGADLRRSLYETLRHTF